MIKIVGKRVREKWKEKKYLEIQYTKFIQVIMAHIIRIYIRIGESSLLEFEFQLKEKKTPTKERGRKRERGEKSDEGYKNKNTNSTTKYTRRTED